MRLLLRYKKPSEYGYSEKGSALRREAAHGEESSADRGALERGKDDMDGFQDEIMRLGSNALLLHHV
jgi:hypothetical protein